MLDFGSITVLTSTLGFHKFILDSIDIVSKKSSCLDKNPEGDTKVISSIASIILGSSLSSSGK